MNYDPANVVLSLEIYPDLAYQADTVLADVTAAIEKFFAFDHLSLGQTIALSEIYQIAHSADGVIGANITRFYLLDDPEAVEVEAVLRIGRDQLAHLETGSTSTYLIGIAAEA